jgi:hypothetical protein
MVKGQLQIGDANFQTVAPPAIPIAGDPDNPGPTYAQLATTAKALFDASSDHVGAYAQAAVSGTGTISVSNATQTEPATFAIFDAATKHNVPRVFADFRNKAGVLTVGFALCEPFYATVKVGGAQKSVMVQVFERRVLTFTASNPAAFQVEMGNIGQHYYQWRYGGGAAPTVSPAPTATPSPTTAPATGVPTSSGPSDPDAYAQYLQTKFGSVGGHKLSLEKVSVVQVVNGYAVTFYVNANELSWLISANKADLRAWGQSLLAELKAHWPNQYVAGSL